MCFDTFRAAKEPYEVWKCNSNWFFACAMSNCGVSWNPPTGMDAPGFTNPCTSEITDPYGCKHAFVKKCPGNGKKLQGWPPIPGIPYEQ
jgi:hypothetical protein